MPVKRKDNTPLSLVDLIKDVSVHIGTDNKFQQFKRLYWNDRVAFVHDCMPEYSKTITPYQEEALGYYDEGYTRVTIRGPHGLGKTFLASIFVHHSILTAPEDCKVPTTASAWRQLEKYLWPEIHKSARHIDWTVVGREPYRADELMVRNIKMGDAEAFAMSSDDETTLEGAHATRIATVFDEAKTIQAATWDALEGAFSTEGLSHHHEVYVLAISTPGEPSGRFYDIHTHAPGYDDWKVRHVKIEEAIAAKRVSAKWVEQRRQQWGEDSAVFQNRVLGQFADNTEDGIIPMSWVNMAVERYKDWVADGKPRLDDHNGKALGIDVARMGQDSTCIAVRYGLRLDTIYQYRKCKTTETAGHVRIHLPETTTNTIEGDNLGASVYDMLRENGVRNVQLLIPGGHTYFRDKSGTLEFLNNRSAMWWNLRELLDPDNGNYIMLPDDPQMIGELVAPQWKPNSRGVIQVEPKEAIKKRIGRSTDKADSVCLAFWTYRQQRGGGVVF